MKLYHIVPCRVETMSCGMHIMRDKHVSSVWRGNIYTYHFNTYRVFRADRLLDIASFRIEVEMKFHRIVSCLNDVVRDAYHAGQTRIECLAR